MAVLSKDYYIDEIVYYQELATFENWMRINAPNTPYSTIKYIDSHYESWAEDGFQPYASNAFLIQPPAPFESQNIERNFSIQNYNLLAEKPYNWDYIYSSLYVKEDTTWRRNTSKQWIPNKYYQLVDDHYPAPVVWIDQTDNSIPYASFKLDSQNPTYPYPNNTERIAGINYDAIATPFKWQRGYSYCFPSHAIPKSFNYEGIHAPMVDSVDFHNYPRPWYKHFNPPETLPNWKRLDPEFIGQTSLTARVELPDETSSTLTFEVKDRDKNWDNYTQFVHDYWEANPQPIPNSEPQT